jgi:predicted acyltransferase
MSSESQVIPKSGRLECLDALRGFDMFWIVGADAIVNKLLAHSQSPFLVALRGHFDHYEWEGFRFYDLIMPLFLFMIGVSMTFSYSKRLQRGDSKWLVFRHVMIRVLLLTFLGAMIDGNLLTYDFHKFQLPYSVLFVLSLGYLVSSIILLNLKLPWQIVTTVCMLVVYWLIQTFAPAPGHIIGVYSPGTTFGDWLNERVMGNWQGEFHRPWIVAMTTYGSTAMLGVFAGHVLRSQNTQRRKLLWLLALGIFCLVAGWAWSYQFPIIKKTWTSTYVLVAGGWSYLLLALFYLFIDVWRFHRWAFPFKMIGMNAIAAYMAWKLFGSAFHRIAAVFTEGISKYVVPSNYPLIEAVAAMLALWIMLYAMYRKGVFLKI